MLSQSIEDVRRLAGAVVTLSFYARVTASTAKLGVEFVQNFGAGGSPSATVTAAALGSVTLTTAWTRFTVPATLPGLVGKTLGTAGSFTGLNFWLSAGLSLAARSSATGTQSPTVHLWGVQVEVGVARTPLEQRDPGIDLAICQRYYLSGTFSMAGYATAGTTTTMTLPHPVVMRAAPTVATSGVTSTNLTTPTVAASGTGAVVASGAATASAAYAYAGTFTATADI
jgi:hypothetical protein